MSRWMINVDVINDVESNDDALLRDTPFEISFVKRVLNFPRGETNI